jgi:hypothetical protein
MATRSRSGLPLAWQVESTKEQECNFAAPLIDKLRARGFAPETCAMDEGNDAAWLYSNFEERKCHPVVPLLNTPAVERGEHKPPSCSMASGDSLDRTQSGEPLSGGARPASASPPHGGSRPTACTHSSRARRFAGASSTEAVPLWGESSDGSRTSGRYCRYGSVALSA